MLASTYVAEGDPDAVWRFTNLSYSYNNLLDGWAAGFVTNQQVVSAVEEAMGLWAACCG